jgi:hypothetical protein
MKEEQDDICPRCGATVVNPYKQHQKPTSKDSLQVEAMKPIAWIKIRELSYMQAVAEQGAAEWKTNLGLKPEPDDEGLYTETQVQKMWESFEQSVTDPENQPSQYGTVPMKEWAGLTDEDINT